MNILGENVEGKVFHFIGVGGVGMCGLAEILAQQGAVVSGSDSGSKGDFERLARAGVKVFRSHDAANVPAGAVVVKSTAIKPTNPELAIALERGQKVCHRADILAGIVGNYKGIAVSGTHGKTSTTALIYTALKAADVDVGIINGGVVNAFGGNALLPQHQDGWLVVEADESDASFLKLKPAIAVITNIEPEHMDTYGTEEKLVDAFVQFANNAEVAVICADDPNSAIVEARAENDVFTYGLQEGADSYALSYTPQGMGMAFDASLRGGLLEDVVVSMPGVHFVQNSLAALSVAQVVRADVAKAAEGLSHYQGVGRRFSKLGQFHGADVIDDYGHHPTEIATTLEAAKQVYTGQVIAVLQPHRFTRLRDLMDEFATCAKVADACVIMPVYAAGEDPIEGITHTALVAKMKEAGLPEEVFAAEDETGLIKVLHHLDLKPGDAIMCMGAGSITDVAHHLAAHAHSSHAGHDHAHEHENSAHGGLENHGAPHHH